MTYLALADHEILLLDGRCLPATQAKVERAKQRVETRERFRGLSYEHAGFVSDVSAGAQEAGAVRFFTETMAHCLVCGKRGGYRLDRKGRPNVDRPLLLSGCQFWFAQGSHEKCCDACLRVVKPFIRQMLEEKDLRVPEALCR